VTSVALFVWSGEQEGASRAGAVAVAGGPVADGFRATLTVRF